MQKNEKKTKETIKDIGYRYYICKIEENTNELNKKKTYKELLLLY